MDMFKLDVSIDMFKLDVSIDDPPSLRELQDNQQLLKFCLTISTNDCAHVPG